MVNDGMILTFLHLHTPLDPLHNDGYQFWSGIGSDLAYIAAIVALFRHWNCHEHGCWRHGSVALENGTRTCHKHDPRTPHDKPREGHVRRLWEQHERSRA